MKSIYFYITIAFISSILCVQFLDIPLAIWIANNLGIYAPHLKTSSIPDALFFIVVIFSLFSWASYFFLKRRNIHDKRTLFFKLTGTLLPLSFALKILLKWIFGRVDTRVWLAYPNHHYDFHWFAGIGSFQGFPSGHMLVFTPLLMALWQFYPRYRFYYVLLGVILSLGLIATEYHFLGDVLAGALIGAVLYKLVLARLSNSELVRNEP
ncbi:phosphatase PAP2 family protein [Methyloradius palustris]|uniref:phosphatase PAP2 family protein n=1 Tax=Methyloradius palustris TaxID=2778876 RepID=UPI001C8C6AB1|nr:phosphatase PAP2 family protein [Methyloradius palustris]